MKFLLDVNALIALGHFEHAQHARAARWLRLQRSSQLLTCSITELGFVRILTQASAYGFRVSDAQALLSALKQAPGYSFQLVPDGLGIADLPKWVKTSGQTTDGHLLQLAKAHDATLATFDAKISGAFVIP